MNQKSVPFVLFFGSVILFSSGSCHDEKSCKGCLDGPVVSSFAGNYFRYLLTPDGPRLIKYDTGMSTETAYKFCGYISIDSIESTKILIIDGAHVSSCVNADTVIRVNDAKTINYCPSPFSDLDGDFPLLDTYWVVEYIAIGDLKYIPPCEGITPSISFVTNPAPQHISIHGSVNNITGRFELAEPDSISIFELAITLELGTASGRTFDNALVQAIPSDYTKLTYSITRNHLTLTNTTTNVVVKLNAK